MKAFLIVCFLLAIVILFTSSITARELVQNEEKIGHKHEDIINKGDVTLAPGKAAANCGSGKPYKPCIRPQPCNPYIRSCYPQPKPPTTPSPPPPPPSSPPPPPPPPSPKPCKPPYCRRGPPPTQMP